MYCKYHICTFVSFYYFFHKARFLLYRKITVKRLGNYPCSQPIIQQPILQSRESVSLPAMFFYVLHIQYMHVTFGAQSKTHISHLCFTCSSSLPGLYMQMHWTYYIQMHVWMQPVARWIYCRPLCDLPSHSHVWICQIYVPHIRVRRTQFSFHTTVRVSKKVLVS